MFCLWKIHRGSILQWKIVFEGKKMQIYGLSAFNNIFYFVVFAELFIPEEEKAWKLWCYILILWIEIPFELLFCLKCSLFSFYESINKKIKSSIFKYFFQVITTARNFKTELLHRIATAFCLSTSSSMPPSEPKCATQKAYAISLLWGSLLFQILCTFVCI